MMKSLATLTSLSILWLSSLAAAEPNTVKTLQTPSGIRFALLGEKPAKPGPILFVFAGGAEDTLKNRDYNKVGHILSEQGFIYVSLDIPCHGKDIKGKEPPGLAGWRKRLEQGNDLVPSFAAKCSAVLDYLIQQGCADPRRIAACGTSRGGFIALHFAAAEPRVVAVAAFAPVTNLLALREFVGMDGHADTKALSLENHAAKLAGRSIWICIGNHDERVNTDYAIQLTRKIVSASVAERKKALVEIHVMTSAGHTIHPTAHEEAAAWFAERLRQTN